jgi:hypothetical protein
MNGPKKPGRSDKGPIEGRDPGGFADGQGGDAQFRIPIALVLDMQGNLLVADAGNRAIRRVTPHGVCFDSCRDHPLEPRLCWGNFRQRLRDRPGLRSCQMGNS